MDVSEMTPLEKGEKIEARDGGEIKRLLRKALPAAMRSQATKQRKYIRLVEISRNVMDIIEPYTPCRRGCSNCCHMAVSISTHEAKLISERTGLTPQVPPDSMPSIEHGEELLRAAGGDSQRAAEMWGAERFWSRYTNVPCSFLKGNECSIYDVRPMACRLHHVLEKDDSKCNSRHADTISAIDLGEFDEAMATSFYDERWGDIREFFPHG